MACWKGSWICSWSPYWTPLDGTRRKPPTGADPHLAPGGPQGPALQGVGTLQDDAARRLAEAGCESARLDALLLLVRATGRTKEQLLAHPEHALDPADVASFWALVGRRAAREPLAYVLGVREFYGRPFRVDRRALIPRPETELLVDLALESIRAWRTIGVEPMVVDVGTGSGAIVLTVAAESGADVIATDISLDALTLAGVNAEALGQADRVRFIHTNLVRDVPGPVHVLLANLPYIPDKRPLPPEVLHEPANALRAGADGLDLLLRLLEEAWSKLSAGATVALEIDEGQGESVATRARQLFPSGAVKVLRDAAGLERVLHVCLPRPPFQSAIVER